MACYCLGKIYEGGTKCATVCMSGESWEALDLFVPRYRPDAVSSVGFLRGLVSLSFACKDSNPHSFRFFRFLDGETNRVCMFISVCELVCFACSSAGLRGKPRTSARSPLGDSGGGGVGGAEGDGDAAGPPQRAVAPDSRVPRPDRGAHPAGRHVGAGQRAVRETDRQRERGRDGEREGGREREREREPTSAFHRAASVVGGSVGVRRARACVCVVGVNGDFGWLLLGWL